MLLRAARLPLAGRFIGWIFAHMSFLIPLDRLRETATLVAFYHPRPNYPFHVLLVPKRELPGLQSLSAADSDFMLDVFQTAQSLVAEFDLEEAGYRLIVNGGAFQDVPLLHFHLVSDKHQKTSSQA
jgi:histidine triad (HIT) family protein